MQFISLEAINSSETNLFNLAAWYAIKFFNLKQFEVVLVTCKLFCPPYEITHIINNFYK